MIFYLMFIELISMSLICLLSSMFMKIWNFSLLFEWLLINLNSCQIQFIILIDWIFLSFSSTILMISAMIMIYTMNYIENFNQLKKISWLIFSFVISMILMISSPSPMSMIIGWDFLGMISFMLILFFQNPKSFNASINTVLTNRLGDITLIFSIILMMNQGSWNIMISQKKWIFIVWISIFLSISSLTKSAQTPFSSWLPQAMAAPTPISALVHSSTLVTAGIYLFLRFKINLSKYISSWIIILSIFTMIMSGIMANIEFDFKKIIALSTLSQMAFMISSLMLNLFESTLFHLLTHAIFKSLMFMTAGIIIHMMNDNQDIRNMISISINSPIISIIFSSTQISLMGLFFLAGFYSKDLIIDLNFMMYNNMFITLIYSMSASLTFSYTIRTLFFMYFNTSKQSPVNLSFNNNSMNYSMILSFILTIFMGSMLNLLFFNKINIIFLPKWLKMIMIYLLFLNLIWCLFFFNLNKINFNFNLIKMKMIISKMIYLDELSKNYFFILNNYFKMNLKEKFWIEFYSKNLITFLIKFSNKTKLILLNLLYLNIMLIMYFLYMLYMY